MIINQSQTGQNSGYTTRTQAVHNLYTNNMLSQKAVKVNASAVLTRSLG